jgi:hypothetical protein
MLDCSSKMVSTGANISSLGRRRVVLVTLYMVVLIFVSLFSLCEGSYFLVSSERKCFTIEQPRGTPVVFTYQVLDESQEIEFSTYYGALALPDLQIEKTVIKDKEGHQVLVTDNDGYYSVCMSQVSQAELVREQYPVRVKLLVTYGHDSEYYQKLAEEEKFDAINLEVHKLNDMMQMTLNEADYQKHKEVEYHEQTEQMDTATLWWPVVQVGNFMRLALA